jgi:hypothetical protein
MARFFLNVINRIGSAPDEEGMELASLELAIAQAKEGIRSILADEARSGRLDFDGRVEIVGAGGTILTVVPFPSAFEIHPPAGRANPGS